MTAITIRIRDDEDHQTIEAAKAATHERTAAKALMRAAHLYPDTRAELRRTHERLASARAELDELRTLITAWQRASSAESTALHALDAALTPSRTLDGS